MVHQRNSRQGAMYLRIGSETVCKIKALTQCAINSKFNRIRIEKNELMCVTASIAFKLPKKTYKLTCFYKFFEKKVDIK